MVTERPVELCKRIAAVRGEVGRLRRQLPKTEFDQTPQQANAAYFLERAALCLKQAEDAWDPPEAKGRD